MFNRVAEVSLVKEQKLGIVGVSLRIASGLQGLVPVATSVANCEDPE